MKEALEVKKMKKYFVIRKLVNENKFEEAIKKAESVKDKQEKAMLLCMIAEAMIYEAGRKMPYCC